MGGHFVNHHRPGAVFFVFGIFFQSLLSGLPWPKTPPGATAAATRRPLWSGAGRSSSVIRLEDDDDQGPPPLLNQEGEIKVTIPPPGAQPPPPPPAQQSRIGEEEKDCLREDARDRRGQTPPSWRPFSSSSWCMSS